MRQRPNPALINTKERRYLAFYNKTSKLKRFMPTLENPLKLFNILLPAFNLLASNVLKARRSRTKLEEIASKNRWLMDLEFSEAFQLSSSVKESYPTNLCFILFIDNLQPISLQVS